MRRRRAKALRNMVHRQGLKPGDPIPALRDIAREHGVTLNTARLAIEGLKEEGLPEGQHGSGRYVS